MTSSLNTHVHDFFQLTKRQVAAEYLSRRAPAFLEETIYLISNGRRPEICKNPVLIFGNQKSGTSAIAGLLAKYTSLTLTMDLRSLSIAEQDALHERTLSTHKFIMRHRLEFSNNIIKDPSLTLVLHEVMKYFSYPKSIFVARDPRDNIRSILDRLGICGKSNNIPQKIEFPLAWLKVLDSAWLGGSSKDLIGSLAERWNFCIDRYLMESEKLCLIKYEDFNRDKLGQIAMIADYCGVPRQANITDTLDYEFQNRGRNRGVAWLEFFGPDNLSRIEDICKSHMKHLGYTQ